MGIKPQEECSVICRSDTDDSSTRVCPPCLSAWAEERSASALCLVGGAPQTYQAQWEGTKSQPAMKTMVRDIGMSVAPTTYKENQGFVHGSACRQWKWANDDDNNSTTAGHHGCAPSSYSCAVSQCTDTDRRRTRLRQTIFSLADFNQWHSSTDTCKYVNIAQLDVKENYTQGIAARHNTDSDVARTSEASHTHLGCHTPLQREGSTVRNFPNWVRAVNPEAKRPVSLGSEESWPPLLACSKKEELHQNQGDVCFGSMEYQSHSFAAMPRGKPAVPLDEQSWPSLEKSCKPSVLHDDFCGGGDRRRTGRPIIKSNMYQQAETSHTMQSQRHQAEQFRPHGAFHQTENIRIPPLLVMLNKDFIVTSPLKENLLLSLVLMGKRTDVEASTSFHDETTEGETKRQILVGQFKALSSFLNFMLGRDATRVRSESNAGGTSTISESLSVEYFVRRFQAKDIITEMEVEYQSLNWKKVDYICTLYGQRVGVSVTRAMSFPDPKDFSAQMACKLLYKKLFGLVVARHGVSTRHSFSRCILHVWCETRQTATLMQEEYHGVSQELDIADEVVMVLTIADGHHARPIFYESLVQNG